MGRKIYYSFHEIPFHTPSIKFTPEELKHLLISIGVLTVAFSIASMGIFHKSLSRFVLALPVSFLAIITAFACHEIAHKYAGMKYGYWSEYRMFPQGLLLALIFSFIGIIFAAPGAVHIFGMPSREESGKIAMAGPLANIVMAIIFLFMASFSNILFWIAYINAFLAFFNLIPLGPLDGRKVFAWNPVIWILLIAISLSLILLI